jgi:hypothetical protein
VDYGDAGTGPGLFHHGDVGLSPQKTPAICCQVDEFPMTGSRKIQKFV